jgi:hypothetical protein
MKKNRAAHPALLALFFLAFFFVGGGGAFLFQSIQIQAAAAAAADDDDDDNDDGNLQQMNHEYVGGTSSSHQIKAPCSNELIHNRTKNNLYTQPPSHSLGPGAQQKTSVTCSTPSCPHGQWQRQLRS